MDSKAAPHQYTTPAGVTTAHGGPAGSFPIFHTPIAVTVARGFQIFLAFLILILSGLIIHGLALDAVVYALVCVCLPPAPPDPPPASFLSSLTFSL